MKENPFEKSHNPLGLNDPLETREKLDIQTRIATPEDWEACKKLRLEAISGKEKDMFDSTLKMRLRERLQSEKEWREETSSDKMFSVLSWSGSNPVGLGRTKKIKDVWRIRNGYVKPEFRNMGIQQKMLVLRLHEIIKRGGTKAVTGIRINNPISIHNAEKFGFKTIETDDRWHHMELDLTNPEIITKINDALK